MIGSCGEPDCTVDCKPFVCKDCSANTLHIDEYYMLTDEVWDSIYKKRRGMLCIGCVESRLGRKLVPADFADVPLNYFPTFSKRLADRRAQLQLNY